MAGFRVWRLRTGWLAKWELLGELVRPVWLVLRRGKPVWLVEPVRLACLISFVRPVWLILRRGQPVWLVEPVRLVVLAKRVWLVERRVKSVWLFLRVWQAEPVWLVGHGS